MARFGHLAIVFFGALGGVTQATAPAGPDRPVDAATASSNQSLSLESNQAPELQVVVRTEAQQAVSDSETTGGGAAKAPIFLGRRQPASAPGPIGAETPWYRSSFGALGLVLGLMALVYVGLRRWAPSLKAQDGGLIRVLSRTVVGPRQSLVMVRVGQRLLLVGVSPDRMERICEISDTEEVASLTAQSASGRTSPDFSSWLDREAAEFARSQPHEVAEEASVRHGRSAKSLSDLLRRLKAAKV